MVWTRSPPRADAPTFHNPSPTFTQQLPKTLHRTLKYLFLLLLALAYIYILSSLHSTSPTAQSPSLHITTNHTASLPTIGKVTASFGGPDPIYDSAILSHTNHNNLHGYPHFILREQMLKGLWTKHACLLTIIGAELAKPEGQRLKWLFWHDRDTILMNPHISLDVFLPPEPEFQHVNLLVTKDRNGLNNGVFFVRVSEWSLKMFASALSIREYMPDLILKYTEQSGMENTIERPWWNSSVTYIPQRWFNGFPPSARSTNSSSAARPGSLLIHFASNRDGLRPKRMAHWDEVARNKSVEWYKTFDQTGYGMEIAEYWDRLRKNESMERVCADIEKKAWD